MRDMFIYVWLQNWVQEHFNLFIHHIYFCLDYPISPRFLLCLVYSTHLMFDWSNQQYQLIKIIPSKGFISYTTCIQSLISIHYHNTVVINTIDRRVYSLRPVGACLLQCTGPSLFQVIVWCLYSAKHFLKHDDLLSIATLGTNFSKILIKRYFSNALENAVCHFVQSLLC